MMFGRHAWLPVDLMFGVPREPGNASPEVDSGTPWSVEVRLQKSRGADQEGCEMTEEGLWPEDTGCPIVAWWIGLGARYESEWSGKLADRWESIPYIVIKQPDTTMPVYVVKPEVGQVQEQVLHQTLLCTCPVPPVPIDTEEADVSPPSPEMSSGALLIVRTLVLVQVGHCWGFCVLQVGQRTEGWQERLQGNQKLIRNQWRGGQLDLQKV